MEFSFVNFSVLKWELIKRERVTTVVPLWCVFMVVLHMWACHLGMDLVQLECRQTDKQPQWFAPIIIGFSIYIYIYIYIYILVINIWGEKRFRVGPKSTNKKTPAQEILEQGMNTQCG